MSAKLMNRDARSANAIGQRAVARGATSEINYDLGKWLLALSCDQSCESVLRTTGVEARNYMQDGRGSIVHLTGV